MEQERRQKEEREGRKEDEYTTNKNEFYWKIQCQGGKRKREMKGREERRRWEKERTTLPQHAAQHNLNAQQHNTQHNTQQDGAQPLTSSLSSSLLTFDKQINVTLSIK